MKYTQNTSFVRAVSLLIIEKGTCGCVIVYFYVVNLLTEEVREQLRLVVVHRSHTHGVEADQAEHRPVERLRLHYLADEESHPPLRLIVIAILTALYTGAGETWRRHDSPSSSRPTHHHPPTLEDIRLIVNLR